MPRAFSLKLSAKLLSVLCIAASGAMLWACQKSDNAQKLAEVDGQAVLATDVEKAAGKELFRLREQLYRLQQRKLNERIDSLLVKKEAEGRGVSEESLLQQEVNSKIPPITDAEISALYEANKSRIPVALDKVRDKIRDFIRGEKISARRALFVKSLRDKAKIVTYLTPPRVFQAQVSVDRAPSKGAAKAAVTLVKFEDFHCPFCKRAQAILADVLARYDGKVRLVHKDFPLDNLHPNARKAAEAARCADEQGKFWPYHDLLYVNAPKADPEDLKKYAKMIELDAGRFNQCLSSGKFRDAVQKDLDEGTRLGITGAPAFFINGRELSGAQPLEEFARVIDEELAR